MQTLIKVLKHIPGAALMFAVVPLLILGYLGWYYYGADHLDRALYSLRKENLSVTSQPPWIESDVSTEVFSRLDQISLLDPNATATIAQAFEAHAWVKATNRVTKSVGGKVRVDVTYRKPIAMVYYSPQSRGTSGQQSSASSGEAGQQHFFYPVDSDGIILPTSDFHQDDIWKYFQVFADAARPAGDVGMSFGDARISQAISLCEFLADVREELELQEIWVHHDGQSSSRSPWMMTIISKDKHRMLWGHAPELEAGNELAAKSKKERLVAWLSTARTMNESQQVDLRFQGSAAAASASKSFLTRP
jgi:hypothetical protein